MLEGTLLLRVLLLAAVAMPCLAPLAMTQQSDDRGAFLRAAETGDVPAVRRLLASGVPVDARDERGRTALLVATHHDRVEAARVLIAAGADVNAKDAIEDSPYLYAAAEGRLEILRMTLAAGADLRSTNRYGGTGLIPAAHHGHPEVVRELLATDVPIDHVNKLGWTALLEAILLGDGGTVHTGIVRQLVEAGADVNLPDANNVTPLAHARERGYTAIARILEAAGAKTAVKRAASGIHTVVSSDNSKQRCRMGSFQVRWDGFLSLTLADGWTSDEDEGVITISDPEGVGAFQISFLIKMDPNDRLELHDMMSTFAAQAGLQNPTISDTIVAGRPASYAEGRAVNDDSASYWRLWQVDVGPRLVMLSYIGPPDRDGVQYACVDAILRSMEWLE